MLRRLALILTSCLIATSGSLFSAATPQHPGPPTRTPLRVIDGDGDGDTGAIMREMAGRGDQNAQALLRDHGFTWPGSDQPAPVPAAPLLPLGSAAPKHTPHPLGSFRHAGTCANTYLILDAFAQAVTHTGWTIPDLLEDGRVRTYLGGEALSVTQQTIKTIALMATPYLILAKEGQRDDHVVSNNRIFIGLFALAACMQLASLVIYGVTADSFDPNARDKVYIDAGIASLKQTGELSPSGKKAALCMLHCFKGFFQLCAGFLGLWITNVATAVHQEATGKTIVDGKQIAFAGNLLLILTTLHAAFQIPERVIHANLLGDARARGKQIESMATAA